MTRAEYKNYVDGTAGFYITPTHCRSKKQYDSLIKTGVKKHNWIERYLVYKGIEINEKYSGNSKAIFSNLINKFIHTLPQMLFVLFPLFAFILKLLYVRKKNYYYVDHVIFSIHFYIFVFLAMLLIFGINKIKSLLHWDWLSFLSALFILTIFFYFYKALRNFYKQGMGKTILKYFIFLFLNLFITWILFFTFFFFSLLQL